MLQKEYFLSFTSDAELPADPTIVYFIRGHVTRVVEQVLGTGLTGPITINFVPNAVPGQNRKVELNFETGVINLPVVSTQRLLQKREDNPIIHEVAGLCVAVQYKRLGCKNYLELKKEKLSADLETMVGAGRIASQRLWSF